MLKIKIESQEVQTQSGTSKAGKPYEIRSQFGMVVLNGETRRVKVRLEKDHPAYAPGIYEIGTESLMVNNYSELAVGRLVLKKAS